MDHSPWFDSVDIAITACDRDGIILYMNEKSAATFAAAGGRTLIGKNLMDCHPEPARQKIVRILESRQANSYTIEKNGVKKLIHQAPWYRNNELGGLVEFSIVLPTDMPHYVRR